MTTADAKYSQVVTLLPYIQVQINDYCGGGFSRQVKEEAVTFAAASSTGMKQIVKYPIVKDTVYITSTDRGTYYFGDTQFGVIANPHYYLPSTYIRDYEVEYSTGGIYIPTTDSRIGSTYSVLVTYSFVDIYDGGKVACARVIAQNLNNSAGIASESVGSLSRSYFGNGMDPMVKSLLAPYRRVKVI
jgi:hypothetical protein